MKLHYIWIADYKGFVNLGFNLATDYVFNYSVSNSMLSRTENKKHINNFFGEGITQGSLGFSSAELALWASVIIRVPVAQTDQK